MVARDVISPGAAQLYAICALDDEDLYLVQGGRQLGPIPRPLCRDERDFPRPVIAHEDLAAAGLAWEPLALRWYPDDRDGLYPCGAWYIHEDGPAGGRYVEQTYGYYRALKAFLRSADAERLQELAGPDPRGMVPCVVLRADGEYETAAAAVGQPIVLAVHQCDDPYGRLQGALEDRIYEFTWQSSL